MSFSDILNKLAEKKALQGDTKFAYNLISIAEKSAEKTDEEKNAEMIKRGKDKKKKASTLELLIQKYAGTKVAAFDPNQPEVPDDLYEEAYNAFIEHLMDYYEESRKEATERAESDGMRAKKSNFIDNYLEDYEQDNYEASFDDRHEEASTRKTTRKANKDLYYEAYDALITELMEEKGMDEEEAVDYLMINPNLVEERVADMEGNAIDSAYDERRDALSSTKLKKISELQKMINKYAEKEGKGSFKNKIKEMDGFLRMDGKAFCFQNNAQAKKALAVAETAANFLNWQVMKGDGCFKLMEVGMDDTTKKKNNLKQASTFDEFLERLRSERNQPIEKQQSPEEKKAYVDGLYDQSIGKFRSYRYPEGPITDAYLKGYDAGMKRESKYGERDAHSKRKRIFAQPIFDDFDVPEAGTTIEELEPDFDERNLELDTPNDAMGRGYDQGRKDPEGPTNNPYDPKMEQDLHDAFNEGYKFALETQM